MNLGNKNWNLMNEFTSKAALYLTKMPGAAMTAGHCSWVADQLPGQTVKGRSSSPATVLWWLQLLGMKSGFCHCQIEGQKSLNLLGRAAMKF